MSSWHSYPSIFNMGHRAITDLLKGPVNVEEKIDGSQFSFGAFETPDGLELKIRSKGAVMNIDAPEKMFNKAADTVKRISYNLHPNWTYRGEYLAKPKHNALAYDMVPEANIILFDICTNEETYLPFEDKKAEAQRIGLECVPLLYQGIVADIGQFRSFLDTTSVLGGQKIEGVVVKPTNYDLFGRDKKVLLGKFVSEAFKEVHTQSWKEDNPTSKDAVTMIGNRYNSQARWQKALQHLKESGKIENSVRDIGTIIKEIPEDIKKECEQDIKDELFKWAWPQIRRIVGKGVPEWYKELLLKEAFETAEEITE